MSESEAAAAAGGLAKAEETWAAGPAETGSSDRAGALQGSIQNPPLAFLAENRRLASPWVPLKMRLVLVIIMVTHYPRPGHGDGQVVNSRFMTWRSCVRFLPPPYFMRIW